MFLFFSLWFLSHVAVGGKKEVWKYDHLIESLIWESSKTFKIEDKLLREISVYFMLLICILQLLVSHHFLSPSIRFIFFLILLNFCWEQMKHCGCFSWPKEKLYVCSKTTPCYYRPRSYSHKTPFYPWNKRESEMLISYYNWWKILNSIGDLLHCCKWKQTLSISVELCWFIPLQNFTHNKKGKTKNTQIFPRGKKERKKFKSPPSLWNPLSLKRESMWRT